MNFYKFFSLLLFLLSSIFSICQTSEQMDQQIIDLKKTRHRIQNKIQREMDSITNLSEKIIELEYEILKFKELEASKNGVLSKLASIEGKLFTKPGNYGILLIETEPDVEVLVLKRSGIWFQINYRGIVGWISGFWVENLADITVPEDNTVYKENTFYKGSGFSNSNYKSLKMPTNSMSIDNSPIRFSSSSSTTECATTRCSGTTQKGNRCKRRTTNCSGRCWQH